MNLWVLHVTVEDGIPRIAGFSPGLPAGSLEVCGNDDGNRAVLEARQRDTRGRFVIGAYHRRDRAEEALEQAETAADAVTAAGGEAVITVAVEGERL